MGFNSLSVSRASEHNLEGPGLGGPGEDVMSDVLGNPTIPPDASDSLAVLKMRKQDNKRESQANVTFLDRSWLSICFSLPKARLHSGQ